MADDTGDPPLRPDIVHCYNPRRHVVWRSGGACGAASKAVLGSLSAFACLVPDRRYALPAAASSRVSRRNRLRNRLIALTGTQVAVVSQRLGEEFCAYNGIARSRLRLVPTGCMAVSRWAVRACRSQSRAAREPRTAARGHRGRQRGPARRAEGLSNPAARLRPACRAEPRLMMILIGAARCAASSRLWPSSSASLRRLRSSGLSQ